MVHTHSPRPTPQNCDPCAVHTCRDCGVKEGSIH